ncbi:integrase arm-type DNA-binding domain-containing protein [uncultured Roseovarius sp.]|uniref:tyrosine-type recombinase/integrase n=1 Tax=uncultured Roseovarius sp. TaxID=293344 RepID=UPI0026051596|nr:integrase arm-type DNA-binding domain-containing protein [uncultured Roseovarius sp.]
MKKARELSAKEVRDLRHPGKGTHAIFAVGGVDGLLLQITPNNARSWILRCKVGTKRRHIGLGGFPDVSLSQARERAREAKEAIRRGIDPVEERRAAQAALAAAQARGLIFADAVDKYCAAKLGEFRSDKHRKQWRSTLDSYACPAIGKMMVNEIEVQDILRALEPIWSTKTETASRLRGRIENVLAWATVAGHRRGDNPARWRGNLDAILPKPTKLATVDHHPALALSDTPAWFADLRARSGAATRALEFLAMTAARSGEVRGATWAEVDLDAALWIIPRERMKARREHRVPLTMESVALLKAMPKMQGCEFVFAAPRGGMLTDMALSACMRRINAAREGGYLDARTGRAAVPHGLRSTFRDWTAEQGYQRDMAEMALAHNVGTEVERAYRRSDMLERRRAMMAAWGRFLRGEAGAKVIEMGAAG